MHHPATATAYREPSRYTAARLRSKLEDALLYVTAAQTVASIVVIGHAAAELGAATVEICIDPGGAFCIFRDQHTHVIDPPETWEAWTDVADACTSIDPTMPGFLGVLSPGLTFQRTQGRHGPEYTATLTVDEMTHGPSDPDTHLSPTYRAAILQRWATETHAAATLAQADAQRISQHAQSQSD